MDEFQRILFLCWLKMNYPHSWIVIYLLKGDQYNEESNQ